MSDEKRPANFAGAAGDQKAAVAPRLTRRRFTKAGAVAPFIMTLGSRPVWGVGGTCSFSGQLSGNEYATAAPLGEGLMPSEWISPDNVSLLPAAKNCCDNENVPESLDDVGVVAPEVDASIDSDKKMDKKSKNGTGGHDVAVAGDSGEVAVAGDSGEVAVAGDSGDVTPTGASSILNDCISCHVGKLIEIEFFEETDTFGKVLELGNDNLKANAAAAILSILAYPAIKYGYEMDGLIEFLTIAGTHSTAKDVLVCLNSRGLLDV